MPSFPPGTWKALLAPEFSKDYFRELSGFVETEYSTRECYPPRENIFEAFRATPFENVKVVILGQDPYPNRGQAHGLAFSIAKRMTLPPSLRNIYNEIEREYGIALDRTSGDLSRWAAQGVFLLNVVLTHAAGDKKRHFKRGWEMFTDAVISTLAAHKEHLVFMLWGASAQQKGAAIDRSRHLVLTAPHPAYAYQGFPGCGHFKAANAYLEEHAILPVEWFLTLP